MFYKISAILILSLNLLIGQSYFNSIIGNEIGFQSARSFGLGQTHFMNTNNSALALRNPAKLAFIDEKMQLDFSLSGFSVAERRSLNLQDYFGDFLTEGDYVLNNNFDLYNQFGILGSIEILFIKFGFALSHGPWSSLDYHYEEEIRGSASYDDGIIGIRDPIVGYHILEHSGQIDLTSFGFATGINNTFMDNISLGFGVNFLHDGKRTYNMRVIQIGESSENLSPTYNESIDSDYLGDSFFSISAILKKSSFELSLGYEHGAEITSDNNYFYSSSYSGLPIYILPVIENNGNESIIDPSNAEDIYEIQNTFTLDHSNGFNIQKPKKIKIGFNHKEGSKSNSRLFTLEFIKNQFNESASIYSIQDFEEIDNVSIISTDSYFQDFHNINLGIEFSKYNKVFRMGISYKEPSLQILSPVTTLSFGTSREFKKLVFDLGASYSYQKYKYHDLFPVQGDIRPDFDTVHESNWSLISTVSYTF
tara:strand:- start:3065 stop:4498 length:1434 start_codon:yes stop_codon:yes gene_type:complete